MKPMLSTTAREKVQLAEWCCTDFTNSVRLHSDHSVMEFLGGPKSAAQSLDLIHAWIAEQNEIGTGMKPIRMSGSGAFVGFAGLSLSSWTLDEEHLEIGWRILPEYWGKGYATEVAREILDGCHRDDRESVCALISLNNIPSQRVAEKLGFRRKANWFAERNFDTSAPAQPYGCWVTPSTESVQL